MHVFVVGGGWSVGKYDHRKLRDRGRIYGINDAAIWLDNVDVALTMDRLWFQYRWPYLKMKRIPEVWVRQKCDCNVRRNDARDNWKTFTHEHKLPLSEVDGHLYGSNSGMCGVNLAFQQSKPGDNIFLLGFDMCRSPTNEAYWYPPYPWAKKEGATGNSRYREWSNEFGAVSAWLEKRRRYMYVVGHESKLSKVRKISYEDMWAMTCTK